MSWDTLYFFDSSNKSIPSIDTYYCQIILKSMLAIVLIHLFNTLQITIMI